MVCARSSLDLVPEVVVSESVFGILVVKERKDEWRRKRFCESVYKRRKSESSIASMRDEVGHQSRPCEMRWGTSVRCAHPNSYIRQPSSVGREPVIPVRSQLSHGCAKDVHGVMGTRSR